ncbi:restriction endonuclease [Sorangium sp. So ce394]|uniref:restriction endonuclease n=1 Tax=Sorangium sp. So ce394 TaxID=3133310 RepID=UPI003F5B558C
MARRFLVIRTDRTRRDFILRELEQGRLRQGWGWKREHDLRLLARQVRSRKLSDEEARVWRNRRLLDTEPDGLKKGDVIVIPNLPEQGRWVLARVTGGYDFSPVRVQEGAGPDYGHIVAVSPIREPSGKIGFVEADNEHVDARLRATMRNPSRMWAIDALGATVEALIGAIEAGKDTHTPEPEVQKAEGFFEAMRQAAWQHIKQKYEGAEFEHLVRRLLECIYKDGRVEHWGGAGEKGADLIVFTRDPLGIEYKNAVQVKLHQGTEDDTTALSQIEQAREYHKVDAGVVVTTAEQMSEAFRARREALEEELGIDIRLVDRDEFVELEMAHLGKAKANVRDDIVDLLQRSTVTSELLESTPITDRVYEELKQIPMSKVQRAGLRVFHQNRGGGVHLVRVELPREAAEGTADQAARDVAAYLERLAPHARGRQTEASYNAGSGTSTSRLDLTLELAR